MAFSLDIPSDGSATPGFGITAADSNDAESVDRNGPGSGAGHSGRGYPGGVEWRVRLAFLVASPSPLGRASSGNARQSISGDRLRPSRDESRNTSQTPSGVNAQAPRHSESRSRSEYNQHQIDQEQRNHGEHPRHHHTAVASNPDRHEAVHLLPLTGNASDGDNELYAASTSLAPLLPIMEVRRVKRLPSGTSTIETPQRKGSADLRVKPQQESKSGTGTPTETVQIGWEEMLCEVVECEIPIKVLAGNTAFIVRPSVYTV